MLHFHMEWMSLLCMLLLGLPKELLFKSTNLFLLKYLRINFNLSKIGKRAFKKVGHLKQQCSMFSWLVLHHGQNFGYLVTILHNISEK